MRGEDCSLQRRFKFDDIRDDIHSGDINDQDYEVVRNSPTILMYLGRPILGVRVPGIPTQFYKFGSPSDMRQNLVTID